MQEGKRADRRDLYTKANYFEGVATQENSDLDSKQLFAFEGLARLANIASKHYYFPLESGVTCLSIANDSETRVLSTIFCLGGKSILKKIFEPRGGEEKFF